MHTEEKKVEYLELIYDLIFVYILGRSNTLLQTTLHGFVPLSVFYAYILCSLAVIQIWNFSTFYINLHGRNDARDHVFLLINMYLLYYIAKGTRFHWERFLAQYHVAWALILLNIGIQYLIEMHIHKEHPEDLRTMKRMILILFGEGALVLMCIPVYSLAGILLTPVPILFGFVLTRVFSGDTEAAEVDFPHLTERAMLYVVFTFGEMIIIIAEYFEGEISLRSLYFSGMSFLIVVGLFLCYEVLYDLIIDRDRQTNGLIYMMIHVFMILAMNCITTSLSFMRNSAVALLPKMVMLVASFLVFFFCYFALQGYAKPERRLCPRLLVPVSILTAAFVILMILLRENMIINIGASVLYVFAVFFVMLRFSRSCGHDH